MVGTILGPGTIFLMLVGAFATAFNLDQWSSFLYNFIPILIFIIVCFLCKTDIQVCTFFTVCWLLHNRSYLRLMEIHSCLANGGRNSISNLRFGYGGCHCGHCFTSHRGRIVCPIVDFLGCSCIKFYNSWDNSSNGVRMPSSRIFVLYYNSIYVLAAYDLLPFQSQQCLMGYT